MFRSEDYFIDKNNLSESVCEGVTKRLFKDVETHELAMRNEYQIPEQMDTDDAIEMMIASINNTEKSKQKAIIQIVKIFLSAHLSDFNQVGDFSDKKSKESVGIPGFIILKDRLIFKYLLINKKKPHKSDYTSWPSMFSIHAIARIIYRFKPKSLFNTLVNVNFYIFFVIELVIDKTSSEFWVPIEDFGTFLIRRDTEYENYFHIITFVDFDKLTVEQKQQSDWVHQQIKQKDDGSYQSLQQIKSELFNEQKATNINIVKMHHKS